MPKQGQGRVSLAFFLSALRRRRRFEAVIDRAYPAWARRDLPNADYWRQRLAAQKGGPSFSIIMPVHDTHPPWLDQAVQSVLDQFYGKWELLITDDASQSKGVRDRLADLPADHRIDVLRLKKPGGISAASNAALARSTGDYVTFLDHDDILAPEALALAATEIVATPSLDLLFSDEDQLVNGWRARPYFKPGWNPDLLLSQNLVCHMAIYRRTLVTALGGLRPAFDGSQDYDLALRVTDGIDPARVRHIPKILYHWRQSPGGFSTASADRCADAARRALADRLGPAATVQPDPDLPQWPAVRFVVPLAKPMASIIGGRQDATAYRFVEHVAQAGDARGDVLVFLAPGLKPCAPDWLEVLLGQACRAEIGAAGGYLTGPDGALLHAGFELDAALIATSPPPPADADDPGYRGRFRLARSVAAVSGDCLVVRRAVFLAAGGLEAQAVDFWDVDLCLRLWARGLRNVWAPQARLAYASPPLAKRAGRDWMLKRWGTTLKKDPYLNPNLPLKA